MEKKYTKKTTKKSKPIPGTSSVASNPEPSTFNVPANLDALNKRTQRQADGFNYNINNQMHEFGEHCTFITLEKSDVHDIATMAYVSASVVTLYQK